MKTLKWVLHKNIFKYNESLFNIAVDYIKSFGDDIIVIDNTRQHKYKNVDIYLSTVGIYINNLYDKNMFDIYKPSYYSTKFDKIDLINSCCFYMTLHQLKDKFFQDFIFDTFDKIFIKPDSGDKCFSGFTVDTSNINFELNFLTENLCISEAQMIQVSRAFNIYPCEIRYWIVDNEICTNSIYKTDPDNILSIDSDKLKEIDSYVNKIIKSCESYEFYEYCNTYVLDICLMNDANLYMAPKIVEMNCINTSGVYNCDIIKLIKSLRNQIVNPKPIEIDI